MTRYVARRVIQAALLILAVATLIGVVIRLVPGDPVALLLGETVPPERAQALREELGLDRPVLVQYAHWLGRVPRSRAPG
jgi:peptide/nickel transport system permease protein